MTVKPIRDALVDEHVVSVYPNLQPFVYETWQRRLNLYTGRSLSAEALQQEQTVRAGHIAHRGQMLSPGVVTGMEVTLGDPLPANPLDSTLYLSAGMGLTARGEDVVLPTSREISLGELQLYLPEDRLVNPLKIAIQHLFIRSQTSQPSDQISITLPQSSVYSLSDELPPNKYTYDDGTRLLTITGNMTEAERFLLLPQPTPGKLSQRILTQATWRQQYEQRQVFEGAIAQLFQTSQGSQADESKTIKLPVFPTFTLPSNLPQSRYTFNADIRELTVVGPMTTLERDLLLAGYTAADFNASLPRAGILVLQPVTYTVRGNPDPSDPCDEDPENDAYEDQQLVDGCRLLLYLYPDEWLPLPERDERWRNRLAYSIFWAERNNESDQIMPWEDIGVPIALVGFDDTWKPVFVDSHAVVRVGGLPKRRHKLLRESGNPFLWHARIQQFAEQLAEMDLPHIPAEELHQSFRYLPPVGVLPKNAIQPRQGQNFFFPAGLTVQAVPIPLEQLDLAVQESASLVPFDLFNTDLVQVLVPVPQTWYEPRLLINELVSPEFKQVIYRLEGQRENWLMRRILLLLRAKALVQAKTGRFPAYPQLDPEALNDEVTRSTGWFSEKVLRASGGKDPNILSFTRAADTLRVNLGDILTFHVYLNPNNSPSQFEVWWIIDNSFTRKVVWQRWDDRYPLTDPFQRALPVAGEWVRVEVPAHILGLEGMNLYGMAVIAKDGQMEWGHAGKARANAPPFEDEIWVGHGLPGGAEVILQTGWSWVDADSKAIGVLLEANYVEKEHAKGEIPFTSKRALISGITLDRTSYIFNQATTLLQVYMGDRLTTYVYLDPHHVPSHIELWWMTVGPDKRLYRVYWGEPRESGNHMGLLPPSGQWERLEVMAPKFLEGEALSGMVFVVFNGRAAWAHAGKSASGKTPSEDTIWLGSGLPAGAVPINTENWSWVQVESTLTPFDEPLPSITNIQEDTYQTVMRDGVRITLPLEQLQLELREQTPLVRDAIALPQDTVMLLPDALQGKFSYNPDRRVLTIIGVMTLEERNILLNTIDLAAESLKREIDRLHEVLQAPTDQDSIFLPRPHNFSLPPELQANEAMKRRFSIDLGRQKLTVVGPMTAEEKGQLKQQVTKTAGELRAAIALLYEYSQDNDDVFTQLQQTGVEGLLQDLDAKVNQLDDKIDFGFLRIQTNIYRLRQFVLGTEVAGKLAVSPSLAQIAKTDSSFATQQQLSSYFKNLKEAAQTIKLSENPNNPQNDSTSLRLNPVEAQIPAIAEFDITNTSLSTRLSQKMISQAFKIQTPAFEKIQAVQQQAPIIGKVPRTVSIAERQIQPRALETRDSALATKHDVVKELASVSILKDLEIPGVKGVTFGQLKIPQESSRILLAILKGEYDPLPDPSKPNEGDYFAAASKTLDDATGILRSAEGRIQEYRAAIALCQNTLEQLIDLETQVNARLQVIGTELGETRHDLSVSRALLAEEEKRVKEINDRRDRIVNENVPFLVFHRPRIVNTLIQGPTRLLNPATDLLDDPVPACLRRNILVPPQLGTMVDLLKEAPVNWFTHLPLLLDRLNRLETLQSVVKVSVGRATLPLAATQLMQAIAPEPGPYAQSLTRAVNLQHQFIQQRRLQTAQLDVGLMVNQTWKQMRDRAETFLSLGDLIEGGHGRTDLIKQASDCLQGMSHVAACLYAGFAEVLPAIRLNWAQQLSQYDTPFSLQNLSRLPRWGEIEYIQQRELQTLGNWLYRQINPKNEEAVGFINDLVRVCILLASHAPVNQIIAGRVIQDTPVVVGNQVNLSIDFAQVNVGMSVLMYAADNQVVARGVVEDLGKGQAAARIVQSLQPNAKLLANSRVQFTLQQF